MDLALCSWNMPAPATSYNLAISIFLTNLVISNIATRQSIYSGKQEAAKTLYRWGQ
jgi:hypothetical protein